MVAPVTLRETAHAISSGLLLARRIAALPRRCPWSRFFLAGQLTCCGVLFFLSFFVHHHRIVQRGIRDFHAHLRRGRGGWFG